MLNTHNGTMDQEDPLDIYFLCSSSTTLRLLLLAGTYFSEIGVKVSKR